MNKLDELLLAEFFTATGYLERLLFVFVEIENLHFTVRGKKQLPKLLSDLQTFIGMKLTQFELHKICGEGDQESPDIQKKIAIVKNYHSYIEAFLKLPLFGEKKNQMAIQYINLVYRHSFEIHNFITQSTSTEIALPKTLMGQSESIPSLRTQATSDSTPLYFIDEEKLENVLKHSQETSSLTFLNIKRHEKYDHYLAKGHLCMTQKKYVEAQEYFLKARNYRETAEVLTLVAWTYSLQNQIEEAKLYCLKAMKVDDKYGPAYNDYGNILLTQGKTTAALRSFELAKRASHYQNREFPYINAGRTYIMLKKYPEALQEFTLALAIAPEHQELHETINKIKTQFLKNEFPREFTEGQLPT